MRNSAEIQQIIEDKTHYRIDQNKTHIPVYTPVITGKMGFGVEGTDYSQPYFANKEDARRYGERIIKHGQSLSEIMGMMGVNLTEELLNQLYSPEGVNLPLSNFMFVTHYKAILALRENEQEKELVPTL